jgi:hypothetical protein
MDGSRNRQYSAPSPTDVSKIPPRNREKEQKAMEILVSASSADQTRQYSYERPRIEELGSLSELTAYSVSVRVP